MTSGLKRRTSSLGPLNRTSNSGTSSQRAFYELPENKQTAAQIVRESRDWLNTVSTRRPFTPKNSVRSLFGEAYKDDISRPTSATKFTTPYFDVSDTIRQSKAAPLLKPINVSITFHFMLCRLRCYMSLVIG